MNLTGLWKDDRGELLVLLYITKLEEKKVGEVMLITLEADLKIVSGDCRRLEQSQSMESMELASVLSEYSGEILTLKKESMKLTSVLPKRLREVLILKERTLSIAGDLWKIEGVVI